MKENCYKSGRNARCSAIAENKSDERSRAANAVMVLGCAAAVVFLTLSVSGSEKDNAVKYYTNAENETVYSVFASEDDSGVRAEQKNTLVGRLVDLAGDLFGIEGLSG